MSNSGRAIRMEFETLRSLAAASIPVTYVTGAIGGPMANPIVQFKVDNLTDGDLLFSTDGVHDHFVVPARSFFLSDVSSNQVLRQGLYLAKGQTVYVKQLTAPTTGSVYLTVVFGETGL